MHHETELSQAGRRAKHAEVTSRWSRWQSLAGYASAIPIS